MRLIPTYYISHGGGPWPFMKTEYGKTYFRLCAALRDMPNQIGVTPSAVLVVSAHWTAPEFSLTAGTKPAMIYDYSGFPDYTYQIDYPANGNPELAGDIKELLSQAGIEANLDVERGFDHGMYSAMYPIYPKANVPVIQLSLKKQLDPEDHIKLGRALMSLRQKNVLIIGSGLSYHNSRKFGPEGYAASAAFDGWLQDTMMSSPETRIDKLLNWEKAPSARDAHPHEEHLLPLMVAVGAAEQEEATCIYHETSFFGWLTVSSFRFG